MQFVYPIGATPLNNDEIYNLIPKHLTTQNELNEWEQYNIVIGAEWAFKHKRNQIFLIKFAQDLHKKMFNKTWTWAGKFRQHQTNIGIESIYIRQELKMLFDDTIYLIENKTYGIREIAVRLHHRLVFIHPFPNGNGRFSRLFADLLLVNRNEQRFSWGKSNLTIDSKTRKLYLNALKEADNNNYSELIKFADS
ncbi:MAG: mobile mystery protein B [Rickettsia endosymbiont of Labidopullus appendiculatus]|nr:mobile mystery protein B [Rickettsia endosymbiont of Labidopullus appendiculatus]